MFRNGKHLTSLPAHGHHEFSGRAVYITVYYVYADVLVVMVAIPVQFLISPIHGAIINWFAHKYGYRNFEVGDTSRNFLPVDFLMMGESYHNNHHKNGSRANFGGIRWHEIDPTFQVMGINRLGIIQIAEAQTDIQRNSLEKMIK